MEFLPLKNKVLVIKHAELERASDSSLFRSKCPVCKEGLLLVQRDQVTLKLVEYDNCILCGQLFRYEDIEEIRRLGGE